MDIYTAQYKYNGPDRMDITAKGNPSHILAPTWNMVNAVKAGKLSEWNYTIQYFSLITKRLFVGGSAVHEPFEQLLLIQDSITFVCFCPPNTFCHRILAARLLEEMGYGIYRGERVAA